jgi:succinate dehydrogenase/fumarate reductase flavoprotein subunit
MGLLNYVTATSLDEDYAHVSRRRAASGRSGPGRPGTVALVVLAVFGVLVATAAVRTARSADESSNARAALVEQVNDRKATLADERDRLVELRRDAATTAWTRATRAGPCAPG